MKRRSFLAMLGLAPVAGAAVSPAAAARIKDETVESAVIGAKAESVPGACYANLGTLSSGILRVDDRRHNG